MRKKLGQKGEEIAEKWLADRGYKIVTRNYTLTGGQIDLVMYSPQGNLVFVEVKTRWARHCNQWRPPSLPSPPPPPTGHFTKPPPVEHRIGPLQILALRRAAHHFLSENPFPFADWQLDLLWITLRERSPVQSSYASAPALAGSPAHAAVTPARMTHPRHARTVIAKIRHYQNVLEV